MGGEARKAKPVGQTKSPIAKDGCRNQTGSPCKDKGIFLQTQPITVSFISAAITEYHGLDELQSFLWLGICSWKVQEQVLSHTQHAPGQRGLGRLAWLVYQSILW